MNKKQVIQILGSGRKLAEALKIGDAAVSRMPAKIPAKHHDRLKAKIKQKRARFNKLVDKVLEDR